MKLTNLKVNHLKNPLGFCVKEKIGLNEQYEEYAIHDTDNFPIAIGEKSHSHKHGLLMSRLMSY